MGAFPQARAGTQSAPMPCRLLYQRQFIAYDWIVLRRGSACACAANKRHSARRGGRRGVGARPLRVATARLRIIRPSFFTAATTVSERIAPRPLPEKLARLLMEARWLLLGALALYLALVLIAYDRADPGWSHAVAGDVPRNPGGRFGAWLADLLLFVFGRSAWWWVGLAAAALLWHRRADHMTEDRRGVIVALIGYLTVLVCSCGIEALRFHSLGGGLPYTSGGMLGMEVARLAGGYFGFTGATLLLLVSFAAGLSLFTGVSWLQAVENFGLLIENAWFGVAAARDRWQDRRAGRSVAEQREVVVETERKKTEKAPKLRIETPKADIEISHRAARDRQASLFEEIPPGGLPPLTLLDEATRTTAELPSPETLEFTSRLIERKLNDFGVEVKVQAAYPGPVITRYEIEPAVGVKGAQIVNLVKDLARALSVVSIRVVESIPGKSCMGLELPNSKRQIVRLSEILGSAAYADMASPLTLALGKDIGGQPVVADLAKMPHLLVAGTTGSGKSVAINAMILSLLFKADANRVRMIFIDPKMLELSVYEGIPHLLAPVVTDMKHAANALAWCVGEMDKRYKLMSALGVRNLAGYNTKVQDAEKAGKPIPNPFSITPESPEPLAAMPYIVLVIDELADLMMVVGKKVEELIARLAQKARAAGVNLILATQRPSVDVITGLIKANIPTRIAFQVSSKVDSRTILDQMGAESLLGQGDMLYMPPGTGMPQRVHGAFVADAEVHRVVEALKASGPPNYVADLLSGASDEEGGMADAGAAGGEGASPESDPLYDQAVEVVLKTRRPSISLVQRHLRIGYNRAARMIEAMEQAGLVSPMNATGGREVLAPVRSSED
ncbi:MAG: DNA translocase FtsK 4TM domain-containing protein [Rhodocyclaceae bacterium]|nr:DNA translocase FtsK 4TM domain-containing protein [Rhodocyclaceae bacterium]MBX3670275.1 DNA translocase FtsK 4TM domain-containing protein [Rhodocyclaceae bacterium]